MAITYNRVQNHYNELTKNELEAKKREDEDEIVFIENEGQVNIWFDKAHLLMPALEFKRIINEYVTKMEKGAYSAAI